MIMNPRTLNQVGVCERYIRVYYAVCVCEAFCTRHYTLVIYICYNILYRIPHLCCNCIMLCEPISYLILIVLLSNHLVYWYRTHAHCIADWLPELLNASLL